MRRRTKVAATALAALLAVAGAGAGAGRAGIPARRRRRRLDRRRPLPLLRDRAGRERALLGYGRDGALGYGNTAMIGDDETPGSAGPVDVGAGRGVQAVSAGHVHTCALLDDANVRCWGFGGDGRLGYGNILAIGDDESPASAGPVDVGAGRTAKAVSAGRAHSCAVLDNGAVRCWGFNFDGRLGYGINTSIGDTETPGSVDPVLLGDGRTATAITTGDSHTCALLDDGNVRCWGYGATGTLGYASLGHVGDDEMPNLIGPVHLGADRRRARHQRQRALRTRLLRTAVRRAGQGRRRCLARFARTPARVATLAARASATNAVVLSFRAVGSDRSRPPAARGYLVKQSRRPIRNARDFDRAASLCRGTCRFTAVGLNAELLLTVTNLRRRTTYYYAVAARDNVSGRLGPRSRTVRVRTR